MPRSTMRWAAAATVLALATAIGTLAAAHLPVAVVLQVGDRVVAVRTHAGTVGELLREAGVAVGPHDRLAPAPARQVRNGMLITVRRARPVVLRVGGKRRLVMTAAGTVTEFLHETRVEVRPGDRVYPAPEKALRPGATVRVVRIETRVVSKAESLPYARITSPDPVLPRGMIHVVSAGRPGLRVRRVAVTTADGVVVARKVVDAVTLRPPQDLIIRVGTRRLIASRGEFAGKEFIYMEATGYAPWHGRGVDGTTSTGMKAGYGVVAVDPQLIPLRSVLYIEGYGRAIAGDVGSAIKGRRIDLGFNTAREAYRFGRRPVRVYILSSPAAVAP